MRRTLGLVILLAACGSGDSEVGSDDASVLDAAGALDAADSPDAPAGSPDAAAGSPDAAAGSPDAAAGSPDAAPGSPDAAAGSPDAAPGSPDAAGPLDAELRVTVLNTSPTNGDTVIQPHVAPSHATAIPVIIGNPGTTPLHLTLPIAVSAVSGGTLAVRDQPAAIVAPGDTTVFTLVSSVPTSGTASGTVTITSDASGSSPFSFTIQTPVLAPASVMYNLDGATLYASTLAGAITQLNPVRVGAQIFGAYHHRGTHAVFHGNFSSASVDLYFVGLPPNLAPVQNLTAALTGASGTASDIAFARNEVGLFTATSGPSSAGPFELYSVDLSSDTASTPVSLVGPPPAGALGPSGIVVSPFGDRVAFTGDLATAGVRDVYVLDLPGGAPVKVSLPLVGMNPTLPSIVWSPDNQHLIYQVRTQPCAAPQFDLFWVDLVTHTTTQLNLPLTGCHPPLAGIQQGSPAQTAAIAAGGNRVAFRSHEATGLPGQVELFVTTNLGGTLTTTGVNGATLPGTKGVLDFAMDSTGTRILFSADGAGGARDLYYTSMAGAVLTTTRVLTVASPSTTGVTLFGARTFVTDTRAIFAVDDQVGGQSRLFTVDLSAAPATFAPVVIAGSGAFPAGGMGVTSSAVKALASATPDGQQIVFATDQGASTAGHLLLYSSPLVSPSATLLGAVGLDLQSVAALVGSTIFFTQTAAASLKPVTVWRNTIGHAGETPVSGAEVAGMSSAVKLEAFSGTRTFYFSQDSTGVAQLWTNDTGTGSTLLSGSSASGSPQIGFKTNAD